ncbi:MAG: choice-of-anchor D domain-containing protein [Alphaproteobacteria bacterium]|nr:choice-of-anchor D domain-containing protein [Alphaproteobacteria bacterium]
MTKPTRSIRRRAATTRTARHPVAVRVRRAGFALGVSLLATTALTGLAGAAPVTWVGTTGFWDVAANWNPGVPGGADTVTIDVAGSQTVTHRTGSSSITSLTNAETLVVNGGSSLTITSNSSNTGTIQAGGDSAGTLNLSGLTLTNTGGNLIAATGGTINQASSTIVGGTITATAGTFAPNTGSTNALSGVTLNGNLNMTSANTRERVSGGLTLNGTINIDNNSILSFENNQTVSGTGQIIFGSAGAGNRLDLDGTGTTTFGSGITIRGRNGTIGQQVNLGGTQILNNQGLISADVAGGNITITESDVTNSGTIEARNSGQLTLQSAVTGGLVRADNGVVAQNGVRITGSTITTLNGGALRVNSSPSNFLDATTISAGSEIDMANSANSRQRVVNGMTLNGTININNNGILSFESDNTISGAGQIVLGSAGAGNRVDFSGNGTTTLGSGITIRGQNGTIGQEINVGGTQTLVNNGTISADVASGTLTITDSAVVNNGILQAQGGGTLVLASNVTGGATGQIIAGAGSSVIQAGITISGTINTSGGGNLVVNGSPVNFLNGVTLNGNLDMTPTNSRERVTGNLVLNGTININNNGILSFEGDNTVSGAGQIVLGNTGAGNRVDLSGNGTTTLGSGITIRGQNGTIGQEINVGGTQTLVNNGTISADVAGGTLTITESAVVNNGILQAQNGATLVLNSHVTGGATGQIIAGAGSSVVQSGVTVSGTINTSGGGSFLANSSNQNRLDAVTLNGNLNMTSPNARERVLNGLTLNGQIDINNNGILSFEGDQTIVGTGQIVLGNTGAGNRVDFDGNGITTLGSGITIRGQNGTIGQQINVGGTQTLVNNGTISADVAGGTLTITESAVVNNGILQAQNGATLVLNSNVTGGATGQIIAGAGSSVVQNAVTVGGTINTSGGGSFLANSSNQNRLDGVTLNGNLNMTSANARERVLNGLVLNGRIDINSNAILSFEGDQTVSGTGLIVFGDTGAGNRLDLDGDGTTTIGSGITIRGQNGTIGLQINLGGTQILANNGLISADVAGGNIIITQSAVNNSGVLEARNGGQLTLESTVTGGTIHADNGVVLQNGARIIGSTITSANGGALRVNSSNANYLDGATIAAGGVVDMATFGNTRERVVNGLTVNGVLNLNSNGILSFEETQTIGGTGQIVLGDTGGGNRIDLDGTGTTTIAAGMTIRGRNGTIGQQINLGGTQTLVNNGLISADVASGTIAFLQSDVSNFGTFQAKNGGTLLVQGGVGFTNQAGGVVEALAGSNVVFQSGATPTNLTAGTLAGGIWRSDSTGGSPSMIDIQGANTAITTNSADIYLIGANSGFQARNAGSAVTSLDSSLFTNNVALRIQEGRSFTATANSGNFINNGLLELASGAATSTFKANTSLTNSATGAIVGYGVVDNRPANAGTIVAQLGTLSVKGGMTGDGTARAQGAAAVLDLSAATAASSARFLQLNDGGALNLGAQNFNVAKDYTNGAFGTGNAFNARANVSGAGQIVGVGTSQAITGDVTGGTTPTATLNFGNVRGGTSKTLNYQVANTGAPTAADLRGAVQTAFSGGGVSDGRLSGAGVTAANFGPLGGGTNTGNLAVTFTASSGGSLTGQSVKVANNFDNVADQVINITGVASAIATGTASPSPVNFGAFRVGGPAPAAQAFSVQNNTGGAGAERLGISSVSTTGNFSAANALGTGLINGGASSAGAVTAQLSGGVAGVNNGTVTINYRSDGTAIDPTFTSVASNSQVINLSATGYNTAVASLGALSFGAVAVGSGPIVKTLSVTNSALAGLFSEDLRAQLGSITGTSSGLFSTAGSGTISNLIAGGTDTTTLKVTLTPTVAGALSASVEVLLASTGTVGGAATGLGVLALPTQNVALTGSISGLAFNLASGSAAPTSANFGNLRVGALATQSIAVTNTAPVDPLTEGLNATASVFSGTGITAVGSVAGLGAGATNPSAISVGLDTSSAGAKSGVARIAFVSDGSIGGSPVSVGNQDVNVSGNVFRLAQASVTPTPVVVAAQRVGGSGSAAVTIANTAAADGFSEGLRASASGHSGDASVSGPGSVLVAAGGSSTAYGVSVNTATAGVKSGTVSFALASDGTGTSGIAGNVDLPGATLDVSGKVYAPASTDTSTATVNFGTVRRGTAVAAQSVAITNTAAATALNDTLVATGIGGPTSPFGATASAGLASGLLAGATGNVSTTMSTTVAGVFASSAVVNLASRNPDMADLSLGTKTIDLAGTVNEIATIQFSKIGGAGGFSGGGTSYVLDLGSILQGTDITAATLRLSNAILAGLPGDSLVGAFGTTSIDPAFLLTGFGTPVDLAPDSFFDVFVDLDTSIAGSFTMTLDFVGASHNAFQDDLALAPVSLRLIGEVVTVPPPPPPPPPPPSDVPEPATGALFGLGAAGLWLMRRRRAAAPER